MQNICRNLLESFFILLQSSFFCTCCFTLEFREAVGGEAVASSEGRQRGEGVVGGEVAWEDVVAVSYTHLRAHETPEHLV